MDTKELIESIITEDEETLNKFIETMDERVSDALEVRKVEIASGLIEAKMKDDDEDDDEDEDEDEDEDDEDEKSMKKEEVEQVDENVASSNDSKEIRRMIARQVRGGGDTLKGGLGARLGGEGRGEISRSNTVRGPTTRKGTLSKRVQRKLASVSKEGGRITGPKGKLPEEVEQIDEVSAGKYAAVAAARGNEWDADVNYEKSNYSPKKLKDVVRRAGKKFGPKVASQLSTMQGTREKRNDARFSDEDDKLAKPFPGYDGAKTTKSGMMHKTFGRVLKNQIKNRLNKEEVEQMDEADKLAGLNYNKGHKLMYKGGKQKIVKTAGSQQAHKAMGWKERHSVKAAMKEQATDFDAKKDQERLDKLEKAMKTKEKPELSPAELAAMKEKGLKGKVGNVNVDFKSVTVREQSVAPGKRQSYERLPDGGMADPNFSKSVDAANKQKEMQMQQKLNAMKNQDAENEKNRPPKVQQEAAQLSDAQKLTLMRTKSPGMVRSALARYRKVGDVNKLSPAHRTLVAGYLEKAGGIDDLPRTVAAKLLKPKKQ